MLEVRMEAVRMEAVRMEAMMDTMNDTERRIEIRSAEPAGEK